MTVIAGSQIAPLVVESISVQVINLDTGRRTSQESMKGLDSGATTTLSIHRINNSARL
jgi:hypothetical protein